MQREINEAIETCIDERKISKIPGIHLIRSTSKNKTLTKLCGEYNYMLYTMPKNFLKYLEENSVQLPPDQNKILRKKLARIIEIEYNHQKAIYRTENWEKVKRQKEYWEFIRIINNLKTKGRINSEHWRELNQQWREAPKRRGILTERLRHMLSEGRKGYSSGPTFT